MESTLTSYSHLFFLIQIYHQYSYYFKKSYYGSVGKILYFSKIVSINILIKAKYLNKIPYQYGEYGL